MSVDKSLKSQENLVRQRNVLTRAERLQRLADEGVWQEGDSLFGLRKVRVTRVKRRSKTKKKKEEEQVEAAPTEGEV